MSERFPLVGERPPKGFACDGCTMSPDWFWFEACVYHDWAYAKLRELWKEIEVQALRCERMPNRVEKRLYKQLRWQHRILRRQADWELNENIRRCAVRKYEGWRRPAMYHGTIWIARVYFLGVRGFGWKAARSKAPLFKYLREG